MNNSLFDVKGGKCMNKVAVITGGGAGIGKGIVLKLAREGYDIGVCDLRPEVLETIKPEVEALGVRCETAVCNVAEQADVKAMMDKFYKAFGRIDVLVNNAGICPIRGLFDLTPEGVMKVFQINVLSMILTTQIAAKYMMEQGGGRIVNACSQSGYRETAATIEYGMTKWGIRGMTRCMAAALAPHNITVNAYCPGKVWTEMQEEITRQVCEAHPEITPEQYKASLYKDIPLQRLQTVEDIANLVYFFVGPTGDNITGQCILVNGGQVMC